jgi:hypothetical protein
MATFTDSFARGIDQTQLMGYSFANAVGELTGIDFIAEWGDEGVQRNLQEILANPPRLESYDDISSLSDVGEYVLQTLGEQAPTLLAMLLPGIGATAAVGRSAAAHTIAKATIGKAIKAKVGTKAFELSLQKAAGTSAAAAAGYVLNTGESQQELRQEGIDNPASAFIAGGVKAALDVVGVNRVMQAANRMRVSPSSLIDVARQAGKEALQVAGVEGITEGLQTVVDLANLKYNDPDYDMFSEENRKNIVEAIIAGAVTGGAAGGIAQSVSGLQEYDAHVRSKAAEMEQTEAEIDPYTRRVMALRGREDDTPDEDPNAPLPPTAPIPESDEELNAQLDAARDPSSSRNDVLITYQDGAAPPGINVLPTDTQNTFISEAGEIQTLITPDPALGAERRREIDEAGGTLSERRIGEILFDIEGGKPRDADRIVVPRDAQGRPLANIVTSAATADAAMRAAESIATTGGRVDTVTATEAIDERLGVPGASEFFYALPVRYQNEIFAQLRGPERPITQRKLREFMQIAEEDRNEIIARLYAVDAAQAEAEEAAVRDRMDRAIDDTFGEGRATEDPVIAAERSVAIAQTPLSENVGLDEVIANEEQRGEQLTTSRAALEDAIGTGVTGPEEESNFVTDGFAPPRRRQIGAKEGYERRRAAENRRDDYIGRNPNPNRADVVIEELPTGRFALFEETLDAPLAPERAGRSAASAADSNVDRSDFSETEIVTKGINRAKIQGVRRDNLLNADRNQAKRNRMIGLHGREVLDDIQSTVLDITDPQGKERKLNTVELARAGRDALVAQGLDTEISEQQLDLAGFLFMVGQLADRGWDVSDITNKISKEDPSFNPILSVRTAFESPQYKSKDAIRYRNAVMFEPPYNTGTPVSQGSPDSIGADRMVGLGEGRVAPAFETETPTLDRELDAERQRLVDTVDRKDEEGVPVSQEELDRALDAEAEQELLDETRAARQRQDVDVSQQEAETGEKLSASQQRMRAEEADTRTNREARERVKAMSATETRRGNVRGLGETIAPRDVSFIRGVLDDLGLGDLQVTLLDVSALDNPLGRFFASESSTKSTAQMEQAKKEFADDPSLKGAVYYTTDGPVIIVRDYTKDNPSSADKAMRTLVIGHELGHIVLDSARNTTPDSVKRRLKELFDKEREKNPNSTWTNDKAGFEEWFADKVAARARGLSDKPTSLADKIFRDVAKQLRKLWNAIKGQIPKRFHQNVSFNQVIDQMTRDKMFDTSDILTVKDNSIKHVHIPEATVGEYVSRSTLYRTRNAIKAVVNRALTDPVAKHLFTADGRLRAIPGARPIAEAIYHESNTRLDKQSYHDGREDALRKWQGELNRALKPYVNRPQIIERAMDQLAKELPTEQLNAPAKEIRGILDRYWEQYVQPGMPFLTKAPGHYFPRGYNTANILADYAGFVDTLTEYGFSAKAAERVADSITGDYNSKKFDEENAKTWYNRWMLKRVFVEKKDGGKAENGLIEALVERGYLNDKPLAGILSYFGDTTRRVEWEKRFGDFREDGSWDSSAKLRPMLDKVDPSQRDEALKLVEISVFPQNADPNNWWHEALGEIKGYESFRVLMMSGVASVPEMGGAVLRSKGALNMREIADEVGKTIRNYEDAKELAEALGVISPFVGSAISTEVYQDPGMGSRGFFRKYLPDLFKYNLNDKIVHMSRVLGTSIGVKFITNSAHKAKAGDETAMRYLQELGINDPDTVLRWEKKKSPYWSSLLEGQDRVDAEIVTAAISRYVDESMVNPNSSERPEYANHPVGGLIFHLKQFATSYNKNVLEGVAREMDIRLQQGGLKELAVLGPHYLAAGLAFIFLGLVSDELRHRILSLGSEGTFDQNRDVSDTMMKWVDRAGFTSLPFIDVTYDPLDPESYAYAAGPTAHHLYEFLAEDYGTDNNLIKIMKSIPGLSQSPDVRSDIRELLDY